MPEVLHSLQQTIKIDGAPMDAAVFGYVSEIVVDKQLDLPGVATVTFADIPGDILSKTKAKVGSRLEISTTAVGGTSPDVVFTGEVTTLEGRYLQTGASIILRAYDLLHRLQSGRHTDAYQNVTDSDVAKKIAQRHGLAAGKVDPTTTTYEHVAQANISDWDFLKARARKNGYVVSIEDGKFNFMKPPAASAGQGPGNLNTAPDAGQLVYNSNLLEFHPRLTGDGQPKGISVRSWDTVQKREVVGSASLATTSAALSSNPASLASAVKANDNYVAVDIPFDPNGSQNILAQAVSDHLASTFAEADGVALYDPKLKAGAAVSVTGVDAKFAGKYVLTRVRHVFNLEYGYRTQFEISGRQDRSLLGLATRGGTNGEISQAGQPFYGVMVGIVTNNKDDKNLGRVKVRFPWLSDKSGAGAYESTWARLAQPGAGPKRGAFFLPEVDDEVLVAFEHGDIHRPYIIGGLYNQTDVPDLGIDKAPGAVTDINKANKIARRGITSRKGHALVFVDDDSADDGVVIRSSDGKLKIQIKTKSNEIIITSDKKITVTAEQELTLESKKDLNIKAAGNVKLEGTGGVDMKSSASFKVEGTTVDVKGSGPVSVAGAMVKLG
jgi:uncharacterized protein involved in type VI secretion and phage assembly